MSHYFVGTSHSELQFHTGVPGGGCYSSIEMNPQCRRKEYSGAGNKPGQRLGGVGMDSAQLTSGHCRLCSQKGALDLATAVCLGSTDEWAAISGWGKTTESGLHL